MEIIENCSSGVKIDIVLLCFFGTTSAKLGFARVAKQGFAKTKGCASAVRKLLTKGLQNLVLHVQAPLIEQLVCHK